MRVKKEEGRGEGRGTGRTGKVGLRLIALALAMVFGATAAFADDGLAVTGEIRTGLAVSTTGEADPVFSLASEGSPGRAQFTFTATKGDLTAKWLLRMANLSDGADAVVIPWAYATGNFLDGQAVVTVGKIDGNTWSGGGSVGAGYDSGSVARFEFKPALVSGLSLGFFLPRVAVGTDPTLGWVLDPTSATPAKDNKPVIPPTSLDDTPVGYVPAGDPTQWVPGYTTAGAYPYSIVDYLAELGFGVKYALPDLVDLRFGLKLDGPDGTVWNATEGEWADDEAGTSLFWGVGPSIVGTFVPGLTVWLDGEVRGLGGDAEIYYTRKAADKDYSKYTTKSALKLEYKLAGLTVTAVTALETWTGWGTLVAISPTVAYKHEVTPWFKPGLELSCALKAYDADIKDDYHTGTGEDPALFDKLFFKVYTELPLGNGFTVTPAFSLTSWSAYGTFDKATPKIAFSDENRLDTKFEIALVYSF
jgi:hypothetical protein